jgi:hypothetical protein
LTPSQSLLNLKISSRNILFMISPNAL